MLLLLVLSSSSVVTSSSYQVSKKHHGDVGSLLVWAALLAVVSAAPVRFPSKTAQNHFEMSPDGSYLFFYDTGPGKHQSFREEKRSKGGTISGSYGYVDPIGTLRITEYVADRKGYRASVDIYKPIHQLPDTPTIIVGPLPADIRSLEEKRQKESVFDRFTFPIEPFESLKITTNSTTEKSHKLPYPSNSKEIFPYRVNEISDSSFELSLNHSPFPIMNLTSEKADSNSSLSVVNATAFQIDTSVNTIASSSVNTIAPQIDTDFSLPVMDIEDLEEELRSMADLLKEDPILLIGPLPGHLPDFKPLSSFEIENNILDGQRSSRSSLNSDDNKFNKSITDNISTTTTDSKARFNDAFKLVIPSTVDELNYVEKNLLSMGENISAFLKYPSSGLLQGKYMPPSTNENFTPPPDKIDFSFQLPQKEVVLSSQSKSRKRNSRTKKLSKFYLSNDIS